MISLQELKKEGKAPEGPPSKKRKTAETKEKEDETIDVEFGIFDPKPSDFYSIKHLTNYFTEDDNFDSSGFADLIAGIFICYAEVDIFI